MNSPKNLLQVLKVFENNYSPIPLEAYGRNPYKTLISTLLSARTKDTLTFKICEEKLFLKAKSIKDLQKINIPDLEKLISPVNFYKTKAKNLSKLAEIIISKFNNKIPETREELITLPGVGRKTANLVLNRAFNIPAIAVDTHVHKISNILGWVATKSPEKTEEELIKIIPVKYHSKINRLFVSIGQQYKTEKRIKEFLKEKGLI